MFFSDNSNFEFEGLTWASCWNPRKDSSGLPSLSIFLAVKVFVLRVLVAVSYSRI
jgi:hypothetical protein